VLPPFYLERVKKDLGSLWPWLPEGAIYHDPHAYMKEQAHSAPVTPSVLEVAASGAVATPGA
jgi:hypothetical protein